jgi:GT2 family glycosyltransferase
MKDKVIAVVLTRNRKQLLSECISSLFSQSYKIDKLIIVDSASIDGTFEMVRDNFSKKKAIEYIRLVRNMGPAGGFNEGIKKAYELGADWIWLMDDDSEPDKNCLKEFMIAKDFLKKRGERIGFLASCVYNQKGRIMNLPKISTKLSETGEQIFPQYLDKGLVRIDNATFVSVLYSRDFVSRKGFPIKEMFIWGDDTEYSYRASSSYPCYLVGKSKAIHKKPLGRVPTIYDETEKKKIDMYFLHYRNNTYDLLNFESKQHSLPTIINWLFIKPLRCLLYPPYRLRKARAVLSGTIAGLFFKPKIEIPAN